MLGKLNRFYIHGLWGEKDVDLRFENNRLVMVGENGSGKTTILRIIYETLACKWTLLSVEDFVCIELWFDGRNPLIIKKSKIQKAKELFLLDPIRRFYKNYHRLLEGHLGSAKKTL